MESVIRKISEIEDAACKIMDDSNEQKRAFAQEMDQKAAAFEKELEAETVRKLDALRDEKDRKLKEHLSHMQKEARILIKQMERQYAKNHDRYVDGLFTQMTSVNGGD